MIHYFKFRQDLRGLVPAKDVYVQRGAGKGWPEECPPIRAANAFGFDVLANFAITFHRKRDGSWRVEPDVIVESDFDYSPGEDAPGKPLVQQYAWLWEKGQKLPHAITDNVWGRINNQVKVSSFLFLKTDPNELLLFTDVPNREKPWRAMSAVVDADWYPASYPWHVVLELDRSQRTITIEKGEPIARVIPVKRDTYFAQQMTADEFDAFFARGQQWLSTHGKFEHEAADSPGHVDITRTYVRQQIKSRFIDLG